jgi:hypothetical protein
MKLDSSGSRQRTAAGFYEHCSETSVCAKKEEFHDQLFKMGGAECSYLKINIFRNAVYWT